jgi:transposase
VAIGIETDKGPWVQALVAAGYAVYAVNPRQVARFRDRHGTSGAKSDQGDAHTLADMVRTDRHQLRVIAGDTPQAQAVKVVARAHQTLIWDRQRHALRLRAALLDFSRQWMTRSSRGTLRSLNPSVRSQPSTCVHASRVQDLNQDAEPQAC